jgi:hypothetical protein
MATAASSLDLGLAGQNRLAGAPSKSLVLEPMRAQAGVEAIMLDGRKWIVGAGQDCTLRLQVDGVDDRHCLILTGPHGPVIKSWGQRTWLNDRPVREASLRDGDRLAIGPVVLRVRKARPNEQFPAAPAAPVETTDRLPEASHAEAILPAEEQNLTTAPAPEALPEAVPAVAGTTEITEGITVAHSEAEELRAVATVAPLAEATSDTSASNQDAVSSAEGEEAEIHVRQRRERHLARLLALRDQRRAQREASAEADRLLQTLVARREELDVRESELKERAKAVSRDLEPRAHELAHLEEALANKLADAATRETVLAAREQRLDAAEQLAARTTAGLARKRSLVSDLAGELLTHQGSIDAQKRAVEHDRLAARRQLDEAATRLAEATRQEIEVRKQLNELTTRESILSTRNEGLERQLRELATGLDRLTAQQATLAARTAEIDARAQVAEALQATLDERAAALVGREHLLEQRDADLQARLQPLAETEARLAARNADLVARTDQLDTLAAELEATRAAAATRTTELDRLAADLARSEATLASREAEVATAAKALEQKTADLELLTEHLVAREQSVSETEQLLAARAELVAARTAEIDSKSAALDELLTAQAACDAEFEQVRQALEAERNELAQREQDQHQVREEMDREMARLAAEESRLEERASELAQRERETDERFELLAQHESSLDRRDRAIHERAAEEAARLETRSADTADRDARENQLSLREQALREEQERLASEASELESARRELDSRRENLAAIAALVGPTPSTPTLPEDNQTERDELAVELAGRVAELEAREAALAEAEARLEAARQAEVERQAQLALEAQRLETELAALAAEQQALEADRRSLDAQAEELNSQEEALARREETLSDLPTVVPAGQDLQAVSPSHSALAAESADETLEETLDTTVSQEIGSAGEDFPTTGSPEVPEGTPLGSQPETLAPQLDEDAALAETMQAEMAALEAALARSSEDDPFLPTSPAESLARLEHLAGFDMSPPPQARIDEMEDWFSVPPSARQFEQPVPATISPEFDPVEPGSVDANGSAVVAEFSPEFDLPVKEKSGVPTDWSALDAQLNAWEAESGLSGSLIPGTLDFPELADATAFPAVSTLSLEELATTRLIPELSDPESLTGVQQSLDKLADSLGTSSAMEPDDPPVTQTQTAWDDLAETAEHPPADVLPAEDEPVFVDNLADGLTSDGVHPVGVQAGDGVTNTATAAFDLPDMLPSNGPMASTFLSTEPSHRFEAGPAVGTSTDSTSTAVETALPDAASSDAAVLGDEERHLQELESRLARERTELAALEQRWRNPNAIVPPAWSQTGIYPPMAPPVGPAPAWPMPPSLGESPTEGASSGPDRSPLEADDVAPRAEGPVLPGVEAQVPAAPFVPSGFPGSVVAGPVVAGSVTAGPGMPGPVLPGGGYPGGVSLGPITEGGLPVQPGAGPSPLLNPAGPGPAGYHPINMGPLPAYPTFGGAPVGFSGMYMLAPPAGGFPPAKVDPSEDVPRPKADPFLPTESGPLINKASALGLSSELESLPNLDLSDDTSSLLGLATRMDEETGFGMFGELDPCTNLGGVAVESCSENEALLSEDDLAELQESHSDSEERSSRPAEPGNVRSLLAEMFGIAELATAEEATPEEGETSSTGGDAGDEVSPIGAAEIDQFAHRSSETPDSSAQAAPAPEKTEPEAEPELSDDESISLYMEKLLARSRPGGGVAPTVVVSAPSVESAQKTLAPVGPSVDELDLSHLMPGDSESHAVHPVGPMVPRAKVDPNELRIRNDFLREVANKTARLALARHRQRLQRTSRLFKAAVTTASLALGGAILSGIAGGNRLQNIHAYVAIGIGLFMGSSLAQDLLRIRKTRREGQLSSIASKQHEKATPSVGLPTGPGEPIHDLDQDSTAIRPPSEPLPRPLEATRSPDQ